MPYKDRERQLEAQREHYLRNKDAYLSRERHKKKIRKIWYQKLRGIVGCAYCLENTDYCIDLHHVKDKTYAVSQMINELRSPAKVIEEIRKCIPVCSNCHRKIHKGDLEPREYCWELALEKAGPIPIK